MSKGLILFVHGLGGSARGTWGRFPELVEADPKLSDYDVGFFAYPTSLFRWPFSKKSVRIQTLADALGTLIEVHYPDHDPVVLVAHSLGGLIARRYLTDEVMGEGSLRANRLLLYAVPNNGAGLAKVGRHISWRHGQLKQLCGDSDLIVDLNRAWTKLRIEDKITVRYVVAALDKVVDAAGAQGFPGNPEVRVLANHGHRDCVKPTSATDLPYEILQEFVTETAAAPRPPRAAEVSQAPLRVIGFDLDGTLVRGLTFSWSKVWSYLGYPDDVPKAGMRRYLQGRTTYAEWCEWAVKLFRAKGLKREHFKEIVKDLKLTRNLHRAVQLLKADGFVTGLISGGIDVFLEELIPDADTLFDYIFINRLSFDADGLVRGVAATDYDFDGKAVALEKMCTDHGHTMAQAVFVGEGFNDGEATRKAGLSIAYPPHAFGQQAAANLLIEEDDLMKVAQAVLGR